MYAKNAGRITTPLPSLPRRERRGLDLGFLHLQLEEGRALPEHLVAEGAGMQLATREGLEQRGCGPVGELHARTAEIVAEARCDLDIGHTG